MKLSNQDIAAIVSVAAEKAIEVYRKEQESDRKRKARQDSKAKKAKRMLASYRRLKASLEESVTFTEDEQIELRWKFIEDLMSAESLMEKSEKKIETYEEKRKADSYCVQSIERAVDFYRRECEKSPYPEDIRRYRELYSMYIDDEIHTVAEISTVENISEKTVYKDLGIACDAVSVYLLGV